MMPVVHGFLSVKGGVGKTSLAIAAALSLARRGQPVAVFDLDLSGTSLADGLALCAPSPGRPGVWLSRDETMQARKGTQDLAFIERYLFEPDATFDPQTAAWRHPDTPTIRWYPSSPRQGDVEASTRRLFFEQDAERTAERLEQMLSAFSTDGAELPIVIVDFPPSMIGLPSLALRQLHRSRSIADFLPVLVSTPDRNDLFRSAEAFVDLRRQFAALRWLLNKNTMPLEEIRAEVKRFLAPQWSWSGAERLLRDVGWSGEGLGTLFRADKLHLSISLLDRMEALLTEDGP